MIGPCKARSRAPRRQAAHDIDNVPHTFRLCVASPSDMSIGTNKNVIRAVKFADLGFIVEIYEQQGKAAFSCLRTKAVAHRTGHCEANQHKAATEQVKRRSAVL